MKKTKIICTMGPNTNDRELMKSLVENGMDIARFNFSHGDHEEQKGRMDLLKSVREEVGKSVAILLDTKGPEIRTGILKDDKKVRLVEGQKFILTTEEIEGDENRVSISYEGLVEDVEIEINPADIKMEVYRASGAGGQHVNKTSSAVRLIHVPTGVIAECQTERSQTQNREYAMRLLKSRLYNIEKEKRDAELANERKSQVGTGDRSEKIRTYNYPQGRITDHRIGMSIYQMENFLNGDIDEMVDNLIAADRAEKLKGEEE